MLEASPSFHCGGTFGQDASTANVGTERACCDCALRVRGDKAHGGGGNGRDERHDVAKHIRRHGILPEWPDVLIWSGSSIAA